MNTLPATFWPGLLSLLDAMIGRPLDEVLREMALDGAIVNSIVGTSCRGTGCGWPFELAIAFEKSDFEVVESLTAEARITAGNASELNMEAISWADSLPR